MYEFQSRIRYSEVDSEGSLTLLGLLNYFQDCSTFQSEDLKIGLDYLKEREMFWALSSWQIVIKRYPAICETVTIGTAPYGFRGFIGYRNFWMKDEKDRLLACANSVWSLIGTEDGRPRKCPAEVMAAYKLSPKLDMKYAPRHISFEGEPRVQERIEVARHHIDTNHHVNNGQYVMMALDYLPFNFSVGELRVEYKMQAHLGAQIYPSVYKTDGKLGVALLDEEGKPYCNVEFSETALGEQNYEIR